MPTHLRLRRRGRAEQHRRAHMPRAREPARIGRGAPRLQQDHALHIDRIQRAPCGVTGSTMAVPTVRPLLAIDSRRRYDVALALAARGGYVGNPLHRITTHGIGSGLGHWRVLSLAMTVVALSAPIATHTIAVASGGEPALSSSPTRLQQPVTE